MSTDDVDKRLDALEREVADLRELTSATDDQGREWSIGELVSQFGLTRRQALLVIGLLASGNGLLAALTRSTSAQSNADGTIYVDQIGDSSNPVSDLYVDNQSTVSNSTVADVELKVPQYGDNSNAVQQNRSVWYNDGSGPNDSGYYAFDGSSVTGPFGEGEVSNPVTQTVDFAGNDITNAGSLSTDDPTINPASVTITETAGVDGPHDTHFDPKDGALYAALKSGNGTVVINPSNGEVLGKRGGPRYSNTQFVYPDPNKPYVWAGSTNKLYSMGTNYEFLGTGSSQEVSPTNWNRPNGEDPIEGREELAVACKGGHLFIMDISSELGSVVRDHDATANGGVDAPHDIMTRGNMVLTVNQSQGASPKVVAYSAFDFSTNSWKSTPWAVSSSINDTRLNGANRVVRGYHPQYAYVGCNYSDTVAVIDIQDVTNINIVNVVNAGYGAVSGLSTNYHESRHLLAAQEETGFEVWDIRKDPTLQNAPMLSYDFGTTKSGHDSQIYQGTMAFAAQATDEVIFVDLGTSSFPGSVS